MRSGYWSYGKRVRLSQSRLWRRHPRLQRLRGLLFNRDAESFHLPVEVAAFEAEAFGRSADIAMELVQFFQDVVALVGFAGLQERGELFTTSVGFAAIASGVAINEHGQMLAVDAEGFGVEDEYAFDEISQLAD